MTLSASALTIYQNGVPCTVNVTITRPSGDTQAVILTVTPSLSSTNVTVRSPGTGNFGSVSFATGGPLPLPGVGTAASATPGTNNLTVTASDGKTTANASLALTVGVAAVVGSGVDHTKGMNGNGRLQEFMSTSIQMSWPNPLFINPADLAEPLLGALGSHHINMQSIGAGIPETSPGVWDFSDNDVLANYIMAVSDHSPELEVAAAPAYMSDSNGDPIDTSYQTFAAYAADLVTYYNTHTGITDATSCTTIEPPFSAASGEASGVTFNKIPCVSTPPNGVGHVPYWGIWNEPNTSSVLFGDCCGDDTPSGPQNYAEMYNVVVPAMKAVDPNSKFIALELSDWSGQAEQYLPTFLQYVTAPVDAIGIHFYSVPGVVDLDLSALGSFSSASLLTIDANTVNSNGAALYNSAYPSANTGPAPVAVPVTSSAHMTIHLGGYGAAFLKLLP